MDIFFLEHPSNSFYAPLFIRLTVDTPISTWALGGISTTSSWAIISLSTEGLGWCVTIVLSANEPESLVKRHLRQFVWHRFCFRISNCNGGCNERRDHEVLEQHGRCKLADWE